jgi:putative phosphoribosyl transferase
MMSRRLTGYIAREMTATESATPLSAAPAHADGEAYIELAPGVVLSGRLVLPAATLTRGAVAFPTVSRGPLLNPYSRLAVSALAREGFATLLFDCLTPGEKGSLVPPTDPGTVARRLLAATTYLRGLPEMSDLRLGYMSRGNATAGAMSAAAELGPELGAVVSLGAAEDLLDVHVEGVTAPVLLIVGGTPADFAYVDRVSSRLGCPNALAMVPGSHRLTEGDPRPFDRAMKVATSWFATHLDHGQ